MHSSTVTKIQSKAYRLIEPGVFTEQTIEHEIKRNDVLIEPYLASVCHADLRYYTGNRRKEALEEKLPMALFHEGLGLVKESHRSEEHTSELQSRGHLVCRLLLEKKKN